MSQLPGAKFQVAALLQSDVCAAFAKVCGALAAVRAASFSAQDLAGARGLIAAPVPELTESEQPPGWPFEIEWVHLLSAGLDNYPRWMFEGVTVTHSPGASAVPVAEFALSMILSHAKRLPENAISAPAMPLLKPSLRIAGATVGIVGFGAVGSALATRCLGLGMKVQAVRRSDRPLGENIHRAASLAELFATSDHVVLAAPATAETFRIVDRELLATARNGLHLVNVARGNLIDNNALLEALESGRIGGASLDVTDPEPLPDGHPFYTHPKIVLTPHVASFDDHVVQDLAAMFAKNLRRKVAGERLSWIVGEEQLNTLVPSS